MSRRKPSFLGLADHKGDVSHFALRLINILVNHLAQANKKRQTEKRKLKEKAGTNIRRRRSGEKKLSVTGYADNLSLFCKT